VGYVRFWPLADIGQCSAHVRSRGIGIATLRDGAAEWSRQYERLGLTQPWFPSRRSSANLRDGHAMRRSPPTPMDQPAGTRFLGTETSPSCVPSRHQRPDMEKKATRKATNSGLMPRIS